MNNIKQKDIKGLYKPSNNSHKGENGRLLVIGGSKLFHASIFWAADVASKIVDLVHFSSPTEENNDLVRKKLKEKRLLQPQHLQNLNSIAGWIPQLNRKREFLTVTPTV